MKTVKNKFGEEVLVDESLLNAKDIIYKTLKKTKFSGVKDEKFFSYLDDEDKNGNQVLIDVGFRLDTYDIPEILVAILNEKLKKTGCCIDFVVDGERINFAIVKKEMSGHIF